MASSGASGATIFGQRATPVNRRSPVPVDCDPSLDRFRRSSRHDSWVRLRLADPTPATPPCGSAPICRCPGTGARTPAATENGASSSPMRLMIAWPDSRRAADRASFKTSQRQAARACARHRSTTRRTTSRSRPDGSFSRDHESSPLSSDLGRAPVALGQGTRVKGRCRRVSTPRRVRSQHRATARLHG